MPQAGDATPAVGATPSGGAGKRSRWDETPAAPSAGAAFGATPLGLPGAFGATPAFTPGAAMGLETPTPGQLKFDADAYKDFKVEQEMDARNRWGPRGGGGVGWRS